MEGRPSGRPSFFTMPGVQQSWVHPLFLWVRFLTSATSTETSRCQRPAYNEKSLPITSQIAKKMPRQNLQSLFTEFAKYASDIAITQTHGYRHESWTYGKLHRQSINFAITLKQRQISTGDRVLLWAPNSAEWLAAFWAILLRGAVAVPMDDTAT